MNKYSKLIKNSGIFAIANMGSSIVSFILVRFYTELLSTEQYGTIDFLTTLSSMLIPFITLAIVEAVLRFGIDNEDKISVLSNGLLVGIIGNLVAFFIIPLIVGRTAYSSYAYWIVCLILSTSLDNIAAQFVRGIGKVQTFAVCGILKTFVLVSCNIFLLAGLKMKVEGYLLSMIVSEIVSFFFLFIKVKLWKYISFRPNREILKEMIIYSLPLMPSSLAWWVMNASDKYMLIAFIGIQANGLYAVAHKLPTLINLCNSLFFQAWQLSAVEESDSNSKQTFYTNVFNTLAMVLLIVCSVLLLIMKPLMHVLVSSDYGEAWKLTPFLVISMVFSAFSSFIGTNYTVTKKTGGALKTTIIGALVNVVLNYFLIKAWGINGAAFATMVSFFVMWIVRAIDTREFIKIKYQYTKMVISLVAIFVQAFVIAVGSTYVFMVGLICLVIVIISYNKDVMTIINEIIKVLRRRLR